MAETAKKISMIPAKVQYDRNVKLSEKKMKVAAYCRVCRIGISTGLIFAACGRRT